MKMRNRKWIGMLGLALLAGSPPVAAQEAAPSQPPAVDYGDIDNWLCHPDNELDVCDHDIGAAVVHADGSVELEAWMPNPDPAIDCFYVYPTTSLDEATYADLRPGRHEEIITAFTQFARFKSVCRVFAPIYRQITIPALLMNVGNLADNDQLNYVDVAAAFDHYLENYNNGRGFVLVGHSQGASLLAELIRNEIDGRPLQDRLVSAILAGSSVIVPKGEVVGGSFSEVPLCETASQTGCAISYATYRDNISPSGEGLFLFGRAPNDASEAVCFNPANPGGEGELDAYLSNIGEIFQGVAPLPVWSGATPEISMPFVKVPGLLSARCVNDGGYHYLAVSIAADPADPRADDIRGDVWLDGEINASWGLHLIDMTLAMGNLVEIVAQQAAAWTGDR